MLTLWNPFLPVRKSENSLTPNRFDSLFDDIFDSFKLSGLDYKKTEDGSFVMTVDLPGVKEEDVNVEISADNVITVSGERKTATSSQSVRKSLTLPEGYDSESLKAELSNGVLTLTLNAQSPPQKETRKVKVNQK